MIETRKRSTLADVDLECRISSLGLSEGLLCGRYLLVERAPRALNDVSIVGSSPSFLVQE